MPLNNAIAWVILLGLSALASATNPLVVMDFPPPLLQNTKTRFEPGEDVKFRWTSTIEWISLELYQVRSNPGEWALIPLLTNTSNSTNFYVWTARELFGMSREDAFHLRLFNANDPNCRHCHSNSSDFFIIDSSAAAGRSLKLGVGLGLGLGIPILVALTAFATWLWVRRRNSMQNIGSQLGEPLVDWKGVHPTVLPCDGSIPSEQRREALEADPNQSKVEIQSTEVVELPVEAVPVEAPTQPAMGVRVELVGDSKRA